MQALAFFATLAAIVSLSLESQPAWAHGVKIGQSKISQAGDVVRYELAVNYDELTKRLGENSPSRSLSEEATDGERQAALRNGQEELGTYLGSQVGVALDGVDCEDTLDQVDVVRYQGEMYAVMSLAYQCPTAPPALSGSYEVSYDLFFDSVSVADRASHSNVADYELGGAAGRFVFERGEQRFVAGGTSLFSTAGRFVALGFEHILGGIDHVLFVLAVVLGTKGITDVLKVASAFTVAHSVTLALAALGWVSVPASIVEPLIALSIAYVAIETMVRGESRHRFFAIFGFGLIHGLGFAETLSFTDQVSWRLISSLLSFNVGIEFGQALIILLAYPLLLVARRFQWSRVVQLGASALIASSGFLWLYQRLFLA